MNYTEPQSLTWVSAFHALFDAYTWSNPHFPSDEVMKLRVDLLEEELEELKQAIADRDLVEIADALTDLQYILSWSVLAFWMQNIFAQLFDEVQRSNMSKACTSYEVAQQTVDHYKKTKWVESRIVEKDWVFIVLRTPDNKVLKSVEYSPASLSPILNKI